VGCRRALGDVLHRPNVLPLLRDQRWVAHVQQLAQIGVAAPSVSKAVDKGLVRRVLTGVVGVPFAWDTFEGRAMAVQLAARQDGFLSGPTAARLYGLRGMPELPIEYTLPFTRQLLVPAWVRLVKTSWPDDEEYAAREDGLVVASPLRTLFGLASQLSQHRFERAAEDAWHLGLVDPARAAEYLARIRRRGRTGVARFETWLEKTQSRARAAATGLEQLLLDLCDRAGLPEPERQHPLELRSHETKHLDIAWPHIRLAIEPGHSWWHGGDLRQRADQRRDRACAEVGWQVIRYDESVWDHQDATVRELRALYRQRADDVRSASGGSFVSE
jgi:very-short-patch-repair endonuclease